MKGFNKYLLQEELKNALQARKPDGERYFFYEDFLTVECSNPFYLIYANWKGYQTEHSVRIGCEKVLEAVAQFQCSKILNDNTNIAGIWAPASTWIGTDWLPRVLEAGVKRFAWVCAATSMNRVLADEAIKNSNAEDLVQTFESTDDARKWLDSDVNGQATTVEESR